MRRRTRRPYYDSAGPSGAIGQRLRRLVEWAAVGSFSAAIGCGAEQVGVNAQALDDGWDHVPCGDLLLATNPIVAAEALDYLGVYAAYPSDPTNLSRVSDVGDPCARATDRATCLATLSQRIAEPSHCPADAVFCNPYVVSTSGDAVVRYDAAAALARVLAPIDSPSEAVLIAQLQGLRLSCAPLSNGAFDASGATAEYGTMVQLSDSGYRVRSAWNECGDSIGDQELTIARDGSSGPFTRNTTMKSNCTIGRRPAGLTLASCSSNRRDLGAFLADCAQLEAASVPAFRRLERELTRFGARQLAAAARAGAHDEVRHARAMTRLAHRYGGAVTAPSLSAPARDRAALEIARENAIEGCVRETFGALLAWQQAARARDPQVAQTMRVIAADETRHAELAWQVAAWLEPQLPARERAQVDAARSAALCRLDADVDDEALPADARALIGWPGVGEQHALVQRMASELGLT